MTITGQEKPSLEDLAHHGVKGMKWGRRKHVSGTDIRAARDRLRTGKASKDSTDDVVAARMTAGEKALALVLGGPLGLAVIGANSANSRAAEKRLKNK